MPGPAETDGNTLVVIDTINTYDHGHAGLPVPSAPCPSWPSRPAGPGRRTFW
ncbi:hypothetical protein ABZX95_49550 [Streptomyces sp. NPDC004232]|uniref:hypothetical protein n=1 Tax=Streptomyces sp. NPDC004232 TaxID=3154454 RepID=UPI0033B9B8AB